MATKWTALVIGATLTSIRASAADAVPSAGTLVPTRRVIVSIPDRRLILLENDAIVHDFPVAVGAPSTPSPTGTFTVMNRIPSPTYYHPGKVVPPGPRNPLGTRWIGLNQKGYGIHGTDDPGSVGHAKSHGCIRLRNADVERLFERLRPGDVVELHAERPPELAELFAEAR